VRKKQKTEHLLILFFSEGYKTHLAIEMNSTKL